MFFIIIAEVVLLQKNYIPKNPNSANSNW